MKVIYWRAPHLTEGSGAFDIRCKTRREAILTKRVYGEELYGKVSKVEVHYTDGLDLLTKCLSGAIYEPED